MKWGLSLTKKSAFSFFSFLFVSVLSAQDTLSVNANIRQDSITKNAITLNDVIITGYGGSTKKKDATGAVEVLSSKSFDQLAASSPAQLLRGKIAGVQVMSTSGEPGAGLTLRIRGASSLRSGNEPLIVIDGVPLAGGDISSGGTDVGFGSSTARSPLNFINQDDIENISILKDASSTAIYGSRGANGVIIITTKNASASSKKINVDYSTSLTTSQYYGKFDVLSKADFLSKGGEDKGGEYNWKKDILRIAYSQNHNLSVTQSSENSNTRISIGASIQNGIIQKTGLDKYTVDFSNHYDILNKKVKLSTKILYTELADQAQPLSNDNPSPYGNILSSILLWNPTENILGGNNANLYDGYTTYSLDKMNPKHILNGYDDNGRTSKLLSSFEVNVSLVKGLKYNFLLGVEKSNSNRKIQVSPYLLSEKFITVDGKNYYGAGVSNFDSRLNFTIEHTLDYNKKINSSSNLNALLGFSYYQYNADGNSVGRVGFTPTQTNIIDNLSGGAIATNAFIGPDSYKNKTELQSFFSRVGYTINKFLATATLRMDGSSKTGANNKYGLFPSLGLAYKLIENASNNTIFNDLKMRLNWGITGNQEFPVNSAIGKITYNNMALVTQNNANPNLKWETTMSFGGGIDFVLIKEKLRGGIDYYYKNTKDLIFPLSQTATQPGPNIPKYINLDGNLINQGIELGLDYNILNHKNIIWNVSFNGAFVTNKLQNFVPVVFAGELDGPGLTTAPSQIILNNHPLYSYNLLEFAGYDDNGIALYKNEAGEAVPQSFTAPKILDKQALPKFNLGFSTNIEYKSFDVATSFYGNFGHYLYNNTNNAFFNRAMFPARNSTEKVISSQQSEADANSPSTRYLEKGDFLRWSNLTIGYTFNKQLLNKIKINGLRVFFLIDNIMVFTNYSGFDPEVDINKSLNGVPSAGIDFLAYPRSRSFSLGLTVSL